MVVENWQFSPTQDWPKSGENAIYFFSPFCMEARTGQNWLILWICEFLIRFTCYIIYMNQQLSPLRVYPAAALPHLRNSLTISSISDYQQRQDSWGLDIKMRLGFKWRWLIQGGIFFAYIWWRSISVEVSWMIWSTLESCACHLICIL